MKSLPTYVGNQRRPGADFFEGLMQLVGFDRQGCSSRHLLTKATQQRERGGSKVTLSLSQNIDEERKRGESRPAQAKFNLRSTHQRKETSVKKGP